MPRPTPFVHLATVALALWATVACSVESPKPVAGTTPPPPATTPTAPPTPQPEIDPLDDPKASSEAVKATHEQLRRAKDESFRAFEQSPIPEAERKTFKGLNYFPVDLAYRFVCAMRKCAKTDPIVMGTSKGDERTYTCYGFLDFKIGETPCSLMVLKSAKPRNEAEAHILFLPFKDPTAGKETYGAGRYIDFSEDPSGIYVLDFNRAYNPYCAYNDNYSCPFPPPENILKVEIRAGEKTYKTH